MLHLQGVELARSIRCCTLEDINGKATVLGTHMGTDMGVSFMGWPLVDQEHRSGQMEAVVLICSLCQKDLQDVGFRLLPCHHLLCKDCFQCLIQELGQVTKAHGTVPDGNYKAPQVDFLLYNKSLPIS